MLPYSLVGHQTTYSLRSYRPLTKQQRQRGNNEIHSVLHIFSSMYQAIDLCDSQHKYQNVVSESKRT